jgi:hypothetical protein
MSILQREREARGSRLRVTRVVQLDAFRQKPFASALTPSRERGTSALGLHARAESVLTLSRALRSL